MRSIAGVCARMLLNHAPVHRGRRFAANRLFPLLKQNVCRVSEVSQLLAPNLRMTLKLDEYPEYMLWMLRDFDEDEIAACRPFIPEGGICVDAGANVGHWSLVFSRVVGAGGRVYAFEPFQPFFQRLEENIALNEVTNVVTIQSALSDATGTIEFDGASCHLAWKADSSARPKVRVPCSTLSGFIEERGITHIDFVKMDIEGAELLALRGMEKQFDKGWRPGFFLELHEVLCQGLGYSTVDIQRYLSEWGYTGWVFERGRLIEMETETTYALTNALFLPAGKHPRGASQSSR